MPKHLISRVSFIYLYSGIQSVEHALSQILLFWCRDLCRKYKDLYKQKLLLDKQSDALDKKLEVHNIFFNFVINEFIPMIGQVHSRSPNQPPVLHVSLTFAVFTRKLLVQFMKICRELMLCACKSWREQKMLQKSGLHEAPPKQEFKEYYGVFFFSQMLLVSCITWTRLCIQFCHAVTSRVVSVSDLWWTWRSL